MKNTLTLLSWLMAFAVNAQKPLPFVSIKEVPKTYTAANVVARMIDALGFRYRWATEKLREQDLVYRPTKEARSTKETLTHILDLTNIIAKTITKGQPKHAKNLSLEAIREQTLDNLKKASDALKVSKNLADVPIVFKRGNKVVKYDFWYLINGPIADAIWHCGQVASFRRTSGNPIPKGVGFFFGDKK